MRYNVGDKLLLCGIECKVHLVSPYGYAYLAPEVEGEEYNNSKTIIGLVFAIVDEKGKDKLGNKVVSVNNTECGAV
jgi:hypothetical protein